MIEVEGEYQGELQLRINVVIKLTEIEVNLFRHWLGCKVFAK